MIYKLTYSNKETAIKDFLKKGVYIEVENIDKEKSLAYGKGIQAVVDIGQIVKVPGEYDDQGNVIVEPIYFDGVFYDVMTLADIDFGTNEVFPVECVHSFAGYAQNADGPVDEPLLDTING